MTTVWRIAAVLLACATPLSLATVVMRRDFRRAVRGPLVTLGYGAVLWCVVAVGLALFGPQSPVHRFTDTMLVAQALCGLGVLVFVSRGRWAAQRAPDVDGAAARPAPGSLSFTHGIAALGDRQYYLRQFALHGPVFRMSQFGTPTMCVFGLERRRALLQQHGRDIGPAPLPFSRSVLRGFLRYMDDATHNHYGPLMRRAMLGASSPVVLERLDALVREPLRSAAITETPVVVPQFVETLVRAALDLTMFGFGLEGTGESDDATAHRFRDEARAFYRVPSSRRLGHREEALLETLVQQLQAQELRLRERGQAQWVPLGRLRELDPSAPDATTLQNFVFMHRIATNNVAGLMTWLLVHWARHPEYVSAIRASRGEQRRMLLQRFLAETLRVSQSEYTYRSITRTFVHDGLVYPAGALLRFCVWESHRDAAAFDAPDQFRIRLETDAYAKARYAPFGSGRHACNGADLNETLCLTLLSALADEIDVEVEHDEPLVRAARHWGHWQPNPKMIVRFRHLVPV